jgi:hypothetical protein
MLLQTGLAGPALAADGVPPKVYPPSPTGSDVPLRPNFSAQFDEPVQPNTIVWTLRDPTGNTLTGPVDYYPTTKVAQMTPTDTLALSTTYTVSLTAADLAGNVMAPYTWTVTTPTCPCSIWQYTGVGGNPITANTPIELGVKFRTHIDGYVTGLRFFKASGSPGPHVGHLWLSTGQLLASATFSDESATGWQKVEFSSPVAIKASTAYVASYSAPKSAYAYDSPYWSSAYKAAGPLWATSGTYAYGTGVFPAANWGANYWVDAIYRRTLPPDTTAPTLVGRSPAAGAADAGLRATVKATFSEALQDGTIAFALRDADGSAVAGALAYDAASLTATFTPSGPLAPGGRYTATVSGATDAAGNAMAPDSWSFSTPACPCTLWPNGEAISFLSVGAGGPIELGVKFRTEVDGYVAGVRFYKSAANTGTHVGSLWSASGQRLASATFGNESTSGWQELSFLPPLAVTAGTTYVASYLAPSSGYSYAGGYFAGKATARGPLTALADGTDGGNGVYRVGGGFPASSYNATNYWVAPVFATSPPADTTAPSLIARDPTPGQDDSGVLQPLSAVFSEPVVPSTVAFTLKDAAGALVPGAASYDPATNTARFTPGAALALGARYTAEVAATDLAGNAMAPTAWLFDTPTCPCGLFDDGASPANTGASAGSPIELGVTFRPEVGGYVTGMRYYRATSASGTHSARLWSAAGAVLATATVTGSGSGWQSVEFAPAVPVTAGAEYVVSYGSPNGGYAYNSAYFVGVGPRGPLQAFDGVYRYGVGNFPNQSYNSTNYWVEPLFTASPPQDTAAPRLVARSPAAGATDAGTRSQVWATLSEPVDPATLSVVLRDDAGAVITTLFGYEPQSKRVYLNPTPRLAVGASYTLEVSGARDAAGNAMAPDSWSFTVAACPCAFWDGDEAPAVVNVAGGGPVELGQPFRSTAVGYVTGVRYYRGTNSPGQHVVNLWDRATGQLLASAAVSGEAAGWRTVSFASPVGLADGRDYVVSYYAPLGGYAYDAAYFGADALSTGPLHTLGGMAGLYRLASSGMPADSYNGNNYWVSPVFATAP